MTVNDFHVIVAGGGIGGLCLAQALRSADVSVAVYERDATPDARLDRYRLHINPAGSRSLRACLPAQAWQDFLATAGRTGGGFGFLTEELEAMVVVEDQIMYPPTASPAGQWYPVDRATLREVLLSGLSDIVRFGKTLEHYETGPGGQVIAHFTDGSQAAGHVLVGADGTRSRVRRQLLPHAEPADTGAAGIGLKLPLTPSTRAWLPHRLAAGENVILAPDPFFLFTSVFENTGRDDLHAAASGDYLLCAFVLRPDATPEDLSSLDPSQLQQVAVRLTRRWHPDLRRLLAECDPGSVGFFPFLATQPIPRWPAGNVTLLGDAIHMMPPTGGLGANTALRDARLLAWQLTAAANGHTALQEAIGVYETHMRGYARSAVRASLTTLRQGLITNPTALAGMRTWLRLSGSVAPLRRAGFRNNWARHARIQPWEQAASHDGRPQPTTRPSPFP